MKEVNISKLSEYISIIERIKRHYPNGRLVNNPTSNTFLFRGLSKEEYKLIPGIYRKDGGKVENSLYLSWGEEKGILEGFIKEASAYLDISPNDLLHWVEYAQHYGVPTRLLDWTSNPLVALYFACKNDISCNAKVWVLNQKYYSTFCYAGKNSEQKEKTIGEHINAAINEDEEFEYPLIYTPFYVDPRMSAQSSYFMAWGRNKSALEDILKDEKYWMELPEYEDGANIKINRQNKKMLFLIKINHTQKQSILHELDFVGINEKTLFPGLDGIGRYIERKYRFDYSDIFYSI